MIRGVKPKREGVIELPERCSLERNEPVMIHGNTKYPELYDRESLEELVKQYGTAARIAQALGCRRQNVDKMLRRLHVKARGYVVSEEEKKRLRMR